MRLIRSGLRTFFFIIMAAFSIGLTISAAGEHLHNPATNTAKMAKWPCIDTASTVFYVSQYLHSPWAPGCGSCIIHVFWFALRIAVPATVFRFTVVLFPLFGPAISSLCFAMIFALSRTTAFITTIGLSSKTASADTKSKITPSTLNKNQ